MSVSQVFSGQRFASADDRALVDRTTPGEPDATGRTYVAIVEIDRFATSRQRIGYTLANRIVTELAERLRDALGGCQTGRVGRVSVEFAFAAASNAAAIERLTGLIEPLELAYLVEGLTIDLSVTIGAADAGGALIADAQLDRAAAALTIAQDRRQKIHLATADTARESNDFDQVTIMRDLRGAIETGKLALHYQPKLRARTNGIDSAEALLRWHHPTLGLVRTDKLIELAEATGAIRELTRWVVGRALTDRAVLAAAGHPLTVFVNISGMLLADASFADWALTLLRGADGVIGFEITETAVIDDPAVAMTHLQAFAAAGIKIAIDDYGSGLSSLAYLKQLPAHELKIDRMFVSGLTDSHRDPLLVRSTIDLAHALEMEVTAEGVDDMLSLSLLRVMGCDLIQGYLVSPPLPLADLVTFLQEQRHAGLGSGKPSLPGWDIAAPVAAKQP